MPSLSYIYIYKYISEQIRTQLDIQNARPKRRFINEKIVEVAPAMLMDKLKHLMPGLLLGKKTVLAPSVGPFGRY